MLLIKLIIFNKPYYITKELNIKLNKRNSHKIYLKFGIIRNVIFKSLVKVNINIG